jgi:hypothetical protein
MHISNKESLLDVARGALMNDKTKETASAFARAIIERSSRGEYPLTENPGASPKKAKEGGQQVEASGTIQELQEVFGAAASGIATGLHDEYTRISKETLDESSPLFRHMSDEARAKATREHRETRAQRAYAKAIEDYTKVISERNEKLTQRRRQAEEELYGAGQNAEVLARLATGSDDQILAAARVAARTNNTELRKAAIATAKERDLGEALVEVLDDNERDLLNELSQAPDKDMLDRVADAERVLPGVDVDRLMPPAQGTS